MKINTTLQINTGFGVWMFPAVKALFVLSFFFTHWLFFSKQSDFFYTFSWLCYLYDLDYHPRGCIKPCISFMFICWFVDLSDQKALFLNSWMQLFNTRYRLHATIHRISQLVGFISWNRQMWGDYVIFVGTCLGARLPRLPSAKIVKKKKHQPASSVKTRCGLTNYFPDVKYRLHIFQKEGKYGIWPLFYLNVLQFSHQF